MAGQPAAVGSVWRDPGHEPSGAGKVVPQLRVGSGGESRGQAVFPAGVKAP